MPEPERRPWQPDWYLPPGETLDELMTNQGLDAAALGEATDLGADTIQGLLDATVPITDDIAAALDRATKVSKQFWLNLQAQYDRRPAPDTP